jgi:hypothetical protein
MFEDESGPKQYRKTAQEPARVERRKLIVPECPKKEESEEPMEQTAFRQYRIESLGRGKKERNEHPDVRNICESGKVASNPLMKFKKTAADEKQHQQDREQKRDQRRRDEDERSTLCINS